MPPISKTTASVATYFKSLNTRPGKPLVLANVWDVPSARAVASVPSIEALATTSWGVAEAQSTTDAELSFPTNLAAVKAMAAVAAQHDKPLTVDFQAGYGDALESAVEQLLECGVVGVNLEDTAAHGGGLISAETAVERIKRVLKTAEKLGVPDFVINARSDALLRSRDLAECIRRGKEYLAAGATCVYVLGDAFPQGLKKEVIQELVRAFDGRLNVALSFQPGNLGVKDYAALGVSRVSVASQLYRFAMAEISKKAEEISKF